MTKDNRYGMTDVFNQHVFPKLTWMLPSKFHEVRVEDLARAMRINAEIEGKGEEILYWKDYQALFEKEKSN